MNQSSPQQNEAALHAVDYWQVIKNRYGIILLTLLLVFMTAAVITYVMPKKYESEATIEVKPRGVGMSPFGQNMSEATGGGRQTPQFFGTEFEKIKSRKSLGKVVIAEGIETSEQLNQLRQMGCSTGQGFHLSRPLSPELVEKLLDGLATRAYSAVAPQAFERVPLFH